MSRSQINDLLSRAIGPGQVRPDGYLTSPRTFGVYRVTGARREGREFRFGNHPVRQRELIQQYGGARLEALYLERSLAELLARLLNDQGT